MNDLKPCPFCSNTKIGVVMSKCNGVPEEYRMPPGGFCGFGERKDGGNADENRDPEN